MDATHGGSSTPPGPEPQPSTIYSSAAADSTTIFPATATCYSLCGALVAIAGIIRATSGHVMGDAILSVAQTLGEMARGGLCSDTHAPIAVRVVAAAPPGLASEPQRSDTNHASGPAVSGHRGHGSPLAGRLCLDCDRLVRPPGPVLLGKISPTSDAYDPSWAARVRCDPCRDERTAHYGGTPMAASGSSPRRGGAKPRRGSMSSAHPKTTRPLARPPVPPAAEPPAPPLMQPLAQPAAEPPATPTSTLATQAVVHLCLVRWTANAHSNQPSK